MGATRTFVHFEAGGHRLGIPLEEVAEIARIRRATPVPRAPEFVAGIANIRGRVVTLLDAERLFGTGDGSPGPTAGAMIEGYAAVLAPPRGHLALFTRSRLDIGRGHEAEGAAGASAVGAPVEGLAIMDGVLVHLIPPAALHDHCETLVLERYRRRV